jgi:hypothetical protein
MHWFPLTLGAAVLAVGCFGVWRGWRARAWPTARGEVVEVGVRWAGAMSRGAHPTIRYRYVVDGRPLEGTRLQFGAQFGRWSERSARAALGPLSPGAPVTVRYDPRDPSDAVLRPEPTVGDGVALLVGVVLVVLGFAP